MTRILSVLRGAAVKKTWTVVGDLASGMPGVLVWRNDTLTGSLDATRAVDELVAKGAPVPATPLGPYFVPDRNDETSAYVMANRVLRDSDVTGEPPEIDVSFLTDLPPGAVA